MGSSSSSVGPFSLGEADHREGQRGKGRLPPIYSHLPCSLRLKVVVELFVEAVVVCDAAHGVEGRLGDLLSALLEDEERKEGAEVSGSSSVRSLTCRSLRRASAGVQAVREGARSHIWISINGSVSADSAESREFSTSSLMVV